MSVREYPLWLLRSYFAYIILHNLEVRPGPGPFSLDLVPSFFLQKVNLRQIRLEIPQIFRPPGR